MRGVTDSVKPSDVGLGDEQQQERGFGFFGGNGQGGRHSSMVARWAPPISYLHLYECEHFSVSTGFSLQWIRGEV